MYTYYINKQYIYIHTHIPKAAFVAGAVRVLVARGTVAPGDARPCAASEGGCCLLLSVLLVVLLVLLLLLLVVVIVVVGVVVVVVLSLSSSL